MSGERLGIGVYGIVLSLQISNMHNPRGMPRNRQFGWMSYILVAVVLWVFYMVMSAKPRPPSGFAIRYVDHEFQLFHMIFRYLFMV